MKIKKVIIILIALNIFVFSTFINAIESQAFIVSKVATTAAKKVAKEVVKDSAVQMAMDIVFNYEMKELMKDDYQQPKDGYQAVCLRQKLANECVQSAQVKVPKTSTEKAVLANSVEKILDKRAGTSSGFAKFLDWFVPIFLIGGALAWLSSKFDSDTDSFFDEVGREALDDVGFILPLVPKTSHDEKPVYDENDKPIDIDKVDKNDDKDYEAPPKPKYASNRTFTFTGTPTGSRKSFKLKNYKINQNKFGFIVETIDKKPFNYFYLNTNYPLQYSNNFMYDTRSSLGQTSNLGDFDNILYRYFPISTPNSYNFTEELSSLIYKVIVFTTVENGKTVIFTNYFLSDGKTVLEKKIMTVPVPDINIIYLVLSTDIGQTMKLTIFPNSDLTKYKIDIPKTVHIDKNIVPNRPINKVPNGSSVPIKTPNGTTVKPDGNGGWVDTDGNKVPVNEDDLIVEDIQTVPKPDGSGEEIKNPNPSKPNLPKPDEKPNPIKPDVGGPPEVTDPETKPEDGPKCDKKLDKIEFAKVGKAMTEAFPFSIPWDIERFINSMFGGVGDKKPVFKLTFFGDGVVMTIPEFFDKWMPFLRNLLIIVFDFGLIFLFYRFTRGGGD